MAESSGELPRATRPAASGSRIALALAGGGLEGAIYEIGALRALDEACDGLDLNQLFLYVGVSAGAFIAACLANDLTSAQMCRAIVSHEPGEHPFVPETFLTPSLRLLGRSYRSLPRLLGEALVEYVRNRGDSTLLESLTRLGRALPVAIFDNEPIRAYLEKINQLKSRTDDFRRLGKRLVVVAADLESGQAVLFGDPGAAANREHQVDTADPAGATPAGQADREDLANSTTPPTPLSPSPPLIGDVPISTAVQASIALPGLYPPVEIGGRYLVDGILLKTLHASVALEAGAGLVICINPIVPVDTAHAVESGQMKRGSLIERGLPTVLSQTLRTIVHSRLEVGMAAYRTKYGSSEVVLLEPQRDDYLMFFTNIFGFAERRAVCAHAYRSTRRYLLEHFEDLAPVFARHGVTLRRDVLEEERQLWEQVGLPRHLLAARPSRRGRWQRRSERPATESAGAARVPDESEAAEAPGRSVVHRLDAALSRLEHLVAEAHREEPSEVPEGLGLPRLAGGPSDTLSRPCGWETSS